MSEAALDVELAEIRRHRTMTRQQPEAAERAQAGIAVATERLVAIGDGMAVLCGRIAQASARSARTSFGRSSAGAAR